MSGVNVEELWRYPIKSCAGEALREAPITETGIAGDRAFMLVQGEDNTFITQRSAGMERLAAVQVTTLVDHLLLEAPGFGAEEIPLQPEAHAPQVATKVHGNPCQGLEVPSGSAYFSKLLAREVRLLRSDESEPRYIKEPYRQEDATNQVAFGDGFPLLLTSRASLHALHKAAQLRYGTVPMNRFRPNIVIDGPQLEPFAEDTWKLIRVGSLAAYIVRACDRCTIPSIVQRGAAAGQKGDVVVKAEFLRGRAGIDLVAPDKPKGRFFGQNLNHRADSVGTLLKVRQIITVEEESAPNILLKAV